MRELREVYFVDGVRSAFGRAGPKGVFWRTRADDMAVKLVRELLRLPDVVSDAAARRETHEVPKYCLDVAALFSQFYRDCRVLSDDPEEARFSGARLALVDAVRLVLANGLGTLGISAPETM